MDLSKVSFGSPEFDALIGGGLERQVVTQIYGEPASGKSTLALMSIVSVLKSGKPVILLDSEGFSAERFRQIAGLDAEEIAKNLYLHEPSDFTEQGLRIAECDELVKEQEIGLIVLDSATALYRVELSSSGECQRKLGRQMVYLLGYARRYNIPVLITNQVYTDIDNNQLNALGGTSLKHISKVIIRLEKYKGHRRAVLEKHRSMPEGSTLEFKLVESGIEKVE